MNGARVPKRGGGRLSVGGVVLLILILALLRGHDVLSPPSADTTPGTTQVFLSATPREQSTQSSPSASLPSATAETHAATRTTSHPTTSTTPGNTSAIIPGLRIATPRPGDTMRTTSIAQLPSQGQDTLRLIARGGPFPYQQDGVTFQNRERLLPMQSEGYYKEYTVVTPGSPDRGARRIIEGREGELYYTDDHYATFMRVVP
jgi:ribonuclease T1